MGSNFYGLKKVCSFFTIKNFGLLFVLLNSVALVCFDKFSIKIYENWGYKILVK